MFTKLNLDNQLPGHALLGFVPQKGTGAARSSAGISFYETEAGEIFSDLDFWSLLPFNWTSWNAVYVDPTVSGTGTGTISDPYKSLDSALNASVPTKTITGVADNGSGLSRVTATAHGFVSGDVVFIAAVTGATSVNGYQTVTVIDANTFDTPAAFSSAYVSGGTAALGKIVYAKPGLYNRAQSFKGRVINSNTVILPWPGFAGQIIASSRLTNNSGGFTIASDTTPGVWIYSDIRGESSTAITNLYVASELPSDQSETSPFGKHYSLAASVAAVRLTQGTYFVEETADEIYTVTINTGTTSVPDPNLLHIMRNTANCSPVNGADSAHAFYAVGVKFLGGSRPFYCAATSGTPTLSTYAFLNCEFGFPESATARDACAFSASKDVYLVNCTAYNSSRDLFGFKAWNDADAAADFPGSVPVYAYIFAENCMATNANFPLVATDANSLSNAYSHHDYCKSIIVGGMYQYSRGGVIHNTNITTGATGSDCTTVALGVWAGNSQAAADNNAGNTDFCIGSSGTTNNCVGWFYRCQNRAWDGSNSTSTYYIRNRDAEQLTYVDNNLFTARQTGTALNALPNFI